MYSASFCFGTVIGVQALSSTTNSLNCSAFVLNPHAAPTPLLDTFMQGKKKRKQKIPIQYLSDFEMFQVI